MYCRRLPQDLSNIAKLIERLDRMYDNGFESNEPLTILSDPSIVYNIIALHPDAATKLSLYFHLLEQQQRSVVFDLVYQLQSKVKNKISVDPKEQFGFYNNAEVGKVLMQIGWYAEAIAILDIALRQATNEKARLEPLKSLALAESYSGRYYGAMKTTSDLIAAATANLEGLKSRLPLLLRTEALTAAAVCSCEMKDYKSSFNLAEMALQQTTLQKPQEMAVLYRVLAKNCLATDRPGGAKLFIQQAVTQAKMTCPKSPAPQSILYAEALEDYAFYLMLANAYQDSMAVYVQARSIFGDHFGTLNHAWNFRQGNPAIGVYLKRARQRKRGEIKEAIERIAGPSAAKPLDATATGTDDWALVIQRRLRTLLAIDLQWQKKHNLSEVYDRVEESMDVDDNIVEVREIFNVLEISRKPIAEKNIVRPVVQKTSAIPRVFSKEIMSVIESFKYRDEIRA